MMKDFSDWLKEPDDTNPLIKAAIAHLHLVAIHPFVDGNGRTARLLALLLLRQYGYGFRNLLSLDSYYQSNRDAYINALSKSFGQQFTEDYDMTPWIKFFTTSVCLQVKSLESRLTDYTMIIYNAHKDLKPLGLNDRQIDAVMYALRVGSIARKEYMEINSVSPLTATRDLADLVKRKLFTSKGAGRNFKYYPTTASQPQ